MNFSSKIKNFNVDGKEKFGIFVDQSMALQTWKTADDFLCYTEKSVKNAKNGTRVSLSKKYL